MDANARPVADERDGLLTFLAQQRRVLKAAAYGLTPEQLRATPSASALSVGGLIKHVAHTERGWMDTVARKPRTTSVEDYGAEFRLTPEDTIESLIAAYDEVAAYTEETSRASPTSASRCRCPTSRGIPTTCRSGPSAGCCCTSSRRPAGMRGTPTSCASPSTAPPRSRCSPAPSTGSRPLAAALGAGTLRLDSAPWQHPHRRVPGYPPTLPTRPATRPRSVGSSTACPASTRSASSSARPASPPAASRRRRSCGPSTPPSAWST